MIGSIAPILTPNDTGNGLLAYVKSARQFALRYLASKQSNLRNLLGIEFGDTASSRVNRDRHRFNVIGIDAPRGATQMIGHQAIGDRSIASFIHDAMQTVIASLVLRYGIPVVVEFALPEPTLRFLIDDVPVVDVRKPPCVRFDASYMTKDVLLRVAEENPSTAFRERRNWRGLATAAHAQAGRVWRFDLDMATEHTRAMMVTEPFMRVLRRQWKQPAAVGTGEDDGGIVGLRHLIGLLIRLRWCRRGRGRTSAARLFAVPILPQNPRIYAENGWC